MAERISRSEQKRRFKQVEKIAGELAVMSDNDLKTFPGSAEVIEEIVYIRTLKGGARKRQVKYLAKLLRGDDIDTIYDFLGGLKGSKLKEKALLHEAERLRDVIINEALEDYQAYQRENIEWELGWQSETLDRACEMYEGLDRKAVERVVYSYGKNRNKVHYRELFRLIMAAIEQKEREKRQ